MKRYHAIQKLLALCLIFSMTLAILVGCAKKEQTPAGTISEFESQAHFQPGTSGDESASGGTSHEPVSGEFVVSEKKYDYNGANLELLYVENQTDRHYNVTIKGKYLDENGNTIKEETQSFVGFAAGWSNNFIFYPQMAFDSFTYTLETKEYVVDPLTGDENGPYTGYTELTYSKNLFWDRLALPGPEHLTEARGLMFDHKLISSHPDVTMYGCIHLLILDSDGEIWCTSYDLADGYGNHTGDAVVMCSPPGAMERFKTIYLKEQPVGEDETIPENVQGVFTAIVAVVFMVDYNVFREMDTEDFERKIGQRA